MDDILPLGNIPSLMQRYISGELKPSQVVQAVRRWQMVNSSSKPTSQSSQKRYSARFLGYSL